MQTFSISDMTGFITTIRNNAAESICENYTEDLNEFITLPQVEQMVINKSIGQDETGCYLITEEIFDSIFEDIRDTIYQTGLAKLAASNKIECAWDDELNDMVFWLNSNNYGQQKINSLPNE